MDAKHSSNSPASTPQTLAETLTRQLRLGGLSLAGALVLVIALGFLLVRGLDQDYSRIVGQAARHADLVANLNDGLIREVLNTRAYLLTGDASSVTSRQLAHTLAERSLAGLHAEAAGLPPAANLALADLERLHSAYDTLATELIALRQGGETASALQLFDERSDPIVFSLLETRLALQSTLQQAMLDANLAYSRRTSQLLAQLAVAFVVLLTASLWLLSRTVAPSLHTLRFVEQALIETVQAGAHNPVRLPERLPSLHTGMVQAYNQLAQQLRDSQAARFDFVKRIVHDLRSPLATISGYAELLQAEARPPELVGERQPALVIARQAARLERTMRHLLLAASIEENQLELVCAPLPLARLVDELVTEARQDRGRTVLFARRDEHDLVLADALHLREALGDLLDNALKFSPADTPVDVALRAAAQPGWLELAITDQGPGIAPDDLSRLFQRFGRIHNEHTRGRTGSGFGLYLARRIVDQHGGQLQLTSRLGQGTRVVVALPLAPASGESSRAAEPA
jgi:signal transduction histidine kinase